MNLRRTYHWLPALLLGLAAPAPAVPVLTNMDLVVGTVEQAVDQALGQLETQAVARDHLLLVAPQGKHAATWLVDHLLAEGLLARGFAVTLIIGLVCNLFTAVVITRMVYDYFTLKRKIQRIWV